MDRTPWFFDPEVVIFTQAAGIAAFCAALAITYMGSAMGWLRARARPAPALATYRRPRARRDS